MHRQDFERIIATDLHEHVLVAQATEGLVGLISDAAHTVVDALRTGRKILLCGNGGSAADAQHLAAELTGKFLRVRDPLPAIALHANSSEMTAIGNDLGFEEVFTRPLRALGQAGDVLLAISTSGNSANVVHAATTARRLGIKVIALTGDDGGELARLADIAVRVPTSSTPRIQEMHITIGHIICRIAEDELC